MVLGLTLMVVAAGCSSGGDPIAAPTTTTTSSSTSRETTSPPPSTTAATRAPRSAPTSTTPSFPTSRSVTPSSVTPPAGLPASALPGVNDSACESPDRPVVLLHGTFSTVRSNFAPMAAALQASGRCVYGIDYGLSGLRPIRESASTVTAFIDEVLAVTGTEQVDVIAFSQGGLVLRAALRLDGLAPDVASAVLIAPTFHGTTSSLIGALPAVACPACADQAAGSPLLTDLDGLAGDDQDLDGDVRYAVVSSRNDTVVTPLAAQVPIGPADRIGSVIVQDQCPGEVVDHIALPADPGVISWTLATLDAGAIAYPEALTCG